MSLLRDLNITPELMSKYNPLSQLLPKYLSQVLKNSSVVTFDPGEQIFEKEHELHSLYFLLKGKLKAKKGMLFSTTLDASKPDSLNPLNSEIPNGVSVKATESGHMLLVDKDFLDRALGWSEAEQAQLAESQGSEAGAKQKGKLAEPQQFDEEHFNWITSLMGFPLFFNLPPSNLDTLFEKFEKKDVRADDEIIREGEEGDYFYLLIEGSARVIIGEDESRPINLNKGSYFGEEALISNTVRSATVIMNEDGRLARLDKESFQSLLNDPLVSHVSKQEFKNETEGSSAFELLDIRSLAEFEHIPLPTCRHIPLAELRQKIPELDTNKTYYLTSEGGYRSDVAAHILCQNSIKSKVIR